jgi:hypothetical protein
MSDPAPGRMSSDEFIAWAILTRIMREGALFLDPPGLTVTGLFPTLI